MLKRYVKMLERAREREREREINIFILYCDCVNPLPLTFVRLSRPMHGSFRRPWKNFRAIAKTSFFFSDNIFPFWLGNRADLVKLSFPSLRILGPAFPGPMLFKTLGDVVGISHVKLILGDTINDVQTYVWQDGE